MLQPPSFRAAGSNRDAWGGLVLPNFCPINSITKLTKNVPTKIFDVPTHMTSENSTVKRLLLLLSQKFSKMTFTSSEMSE